MMIDWDRQPTSPVEFKCTIIPFREALKFLRSMKDKVVVKRYAGREAGLRFRRVLNPIIMCGVEQLETGISVRASKDQFNNHRLEELGIDWSYIDSAFWALREVGALDFKYIDPDSGVLEYVLITEAPPSIENKSDKALDLDHSRQLDVHVWSTHQETNEFVDAIYERYFEGGNENIRKKHLKVVLFDLYLAWSDDPELKIAYSRNVDSYKAKSRYNELHISKLTPTIVDRLVEVGLVEHIKGFRDRESEIGRMSRMWPTDHLIEMFKNAKFGPLDFGHLENRECIILRNEDGEDIEYEDTEETNLMRGVLNNYNALLRRTFIDIPTLEMTWIDLEPDSPLRHKRLHVNQRDKFVRRIFNRGSFEKGGRFFGGWWQRCPEAWREKIFMNDRPSVEIDYSGLHMVLLYARKDRMSTRLVGSRSALR